MISKSKLGAIALIAMIGAVSPAFAQSGYSTGITAAAYVTHSHRAHGGRSGLRAFGMVPRVGYGSDIAPSATGGGSTGYNWAVEHDS